MPQSQGQNKNIAQVQSDLAHSLLYDEESTAGCSASESQMHVLWSIGAERVKGKEETENGSRLKMGNEMQWEKKHWAHPDQDMVTLCW